MARTKFVCGNWKMLKTGAESVALVKELAAGLGEVAGKVQVAVAPPFTAIHAVAQALKGSAVEVSGQDVFWEVQGAFTGEVSAAMLLEAGCRHGIVGHSERRQFFGETDEKINKKAAALYKHGLTPIICCGELLAEREAGCTLEVVSGQLHGCLKDLPADKVRESVIAYEPVWAIGTGKVATTAQAQEVHTMIRGLLKDLYGQAVAQAVRIQYGGSVKPDNVKDLMAQADIDGALVGGASLKADSFSAIVNFGK